MPDYSAVTWELSERHHREALKQLAKERDVRLSLDRKEFIKTLEKRLVELKKLEKERDKKYLVKLEEHYKKQLELIKMIKKQGDITDATFRSLDHSAPYRDRYDRTVEGIRSLLTLLNASTDEKVKLTEAEVRRFIGDSQ